MFDVVIFLKELAEVYRVTYKGPDDQLRGMIVSNDEENGYQFLFKDEQVEGDDIQDIMLKCDTFEGYQVIDSHVNLTSKPLIKSFDHIIPNAPLKSSIRAKDGFSIRFCLFGVLYENITFKYPRPQKLSVPRIKYLISKDGFRHFKVFYAIFENAVEARLKVTLTKKSDLSNLYGIIAARTSAIAYPAYSSIIFYKQHGDKIKVGNEDDIIIPLSRDIVAVPLGDKLILQFGLNGSDNDEMVEEANNMIIQKTVSFYAAEEGTSVSYISCSKADLKVEVRWCSTSHLQESP